MEWLILPKDEDILHYGIKGKSGRKKKNGSKIKIPEAINRQLTSSHKSLGSMKYGQAIEYYKSIKNTSPKILAAWLQKHNVGLNAAQYKKYVMNAVKKAKGAQDTINTKHNITNRVLGNDKRYQSEALPSEKTSSSKTKTKTTNKKKSSSSSKKTKQVKSQQTNNAAELGRALAKDASTLRGGSTARKVRVNRMLKTINKYTRR